MVGHTRPEPLALIVTFSRDAEEPDTVFARDGVHAWQQAIHLITRREWLLSGDTLTVRRAEADDNHVVEILAGAVTGRTAA